MVEQSQATSRPLSRPARALLRVAVIGLALAAAGPAPAADPARLEEIRAQLGSESNYPGVIEQLRALLAQDPGWYEARLQLARVLAWSERYDESLVEYARLREQAPGDLELEIEQAQVQSWQGNYRAARSGFQSVLAREPHNPRALGGLARTHRWDGDALGADRYYRQALDAAPDDELRAEWEELRSHYGPRASLGAEVYQDKSDYTRRDYIAELKGYGDVATRWGLRGGHVDASHSQRHVPLAIRAEHDRDRATELAVELQRRWSRGWETGVQVGGRDWQHATDRPFGRVRLDYTGDGASARLELERADFIDESDSFEALQAGLRHFGSSLSGWRQLSPRWSTWGRVAWLRITDGNQRHAADLSLIFEPLVDHQLALSLNVFEVGYGGASPYYWDPKFDFGTTLGLDHTIPLRGDLRLRYAGQVGYGSSKTRGFGTDAGLIGSFAGELAWERADWKLMLRGEYGYSQRDSRYRARLLRVLLERGF
jgi:hypothetical protein